MVQRNIKEITHWDLYKWKHDSLDTALRCGYDSKMIGRMRSHETAMLGLSEDINALGRCRYDPHSLFERRREKVLIIINPDNPIRNGSKGLREAARQKGIPKLQTELLIAAYKLTGKKGPEIVLQSIMDHEIGHGYHYLAGNEHGEQAACQTQLDLAKERGKRDLAWLLTSKCIPMAARHWKKVEVK